MRSGDGSSRTEGGAHGRSIRTSSPDCWSGGSGRQPRVLRRSGARSLGSRLSHRVFASTARRRLCAASGVIARWRRRHDCAPRRGTVGMREPGGAGIHSVLYRRPTSPRRVHSSPWASNEQSRNEVFEVGGNGDAFGRVRRLTELPRPATVSHFNCLHPSAPFPILIRREGEDRGIARRGNAARGKSGLRGQDAG